MKIVVRRNDETAEIEADDDSLIDSSCYCQIFERSRSELLKGFYSQEAAGSHE